MDRVPEHPVAAQQPAPRGVSRRALLGGFTLGSVAALSARAGPVAALGSAQDGTSSADPQGASLGAAVEPFRGPHQAGISTPMPAHATFVSLDLRPDVDRDALVRMMVLLTDDIDRLSQGKPALADPQPELATIPARLTVTVGYGYGLLAAAGLADEAPEWLAQGLPAFTIDRLEDRWTGGDLLLQVAAEDAVTVSHTLRVLLTDAEPFATVRWVQSGFHRPANTSPGGTGRNLMGQVDGTVNPTLGSEDFDSVVWIDDGPTWLEGERHSLCGASAWTSRRGEAWTTRARRSPSAGVCPTGRP